MREALEALIADMVEKGITFDEAHTEFERRFIQHVLAKAGGNQSLAARMLDMHRNTLCRKIAELRLPPDGKAQKPHARRPPSPIAAKTAGRRRKSS